MACVKMFIQEICFNPLTFDLSKTDNEEHGFHQSSHYES